MMIQRLQCHAYQVSGHPTNRRKIHRAVGQHVYSEIESEKLVGILSGPSLILRGTMAIEPCNSKKMFPSQ
nr:hypothetical protein Iba_chr03aCG18800 [Ipomoea batatas]